MEINNQTIIINKDLLMPRTFNEYLINAIMLNDETKCIQFFVFFKHEWAELNLMYDFTINNGGWLLHSGINQKNEFISTELISEILEFGKNWYQEIYKCKR